MKAISPDKIQIKVALGIRDMKTAKKYTEIGVVHLEASSGVDLVNTRFSYNSLFEIVNCPYLFIIFQYQF